MDLSNLAPNMSNVLNPDTLKVVGVLVALMAGKWGIGKAWWLTKTATLTAAKSMSFVGVLTGLMVMGGAGLTGYGWGQTHKPMKALPEPGTHRRLVAFSDDLNQRKFATEEEYNTAWENRRNDWKDMNFAEFSKKWGEPVMEEVSNIEEGNSIVSEQQNSHVLGSASLGMGIGTILAGIAAFLKKYG